MNCKIKEKCRKSVPWEFCYVMKPPSSDTQVHSTRTTVPGAIQSRQHKQHQQKGMPAKNEVTASQTFLQLKGSGQPFVSPAALSDLEIN